MVIWTRPNRIVTEKMAPLTLLCARGVALNFVVARYFRPRLPVLVKSLCNSFYKNCFLIFQESKNKVVDVFIETVSRDAFNEHISKLILG